MRILDTFSSIPDCFPGGQFDLAAWQRYAAAISPDLQRQCYEDALAYDVLTQCLPVIQQVAADPEKARTAHANFLHCTKNLDQQLARHGFAVDATLCLYLGLCNGAGWVTEMDGSPAVLFGLEKILELDWHTKPLMTALIHHELGHLWHFQTRTAPDFQSPALWQLYEEGMAMFFEQQLAGDPQCYHQDKNGWLAWCQAHEAAMQADYARRAAANESVQDFFGDWVRWQGQPDTGYYLGSVLVRRLAASRSITELANLTEKEFAAVLTDLDSHAIL